MIRVHLIGVCGTGMASLAVLLKRRGFLVSGSDANAHPPMSTFLIANGIEPQMGYDGKRISTDIGVAVIGNAVSRGNPEVEAVLNSGIRYRSFPELLRDEFLWKKRTVVVAGTHGKTTTSSMLAWVLAEAGVDPGFAIGGIPRNFDSSCQLGNGSVFVVEGDEYDSAFFDKTAKFLKYVPKVAIVGNVEFDHADIYSDLSELRKSFRRLVSLIPSNGKVILGCDDPEASDLKDAAHCEIETFGSNEDADWRAENIEYGQEITEFTVRHESKVVARVALPMLGIFNVRNALAAVAAAATVGISPLVGADALSRFRGVRRRLEYVGSEDGVVVYDDFAHHPTAIRETLLGMRGSNPESRIWAIFEPRSATSCRSVFQQAFAESLALANRVIVGRVFRSNIPDSDKLSERRLVADLTKAGVWARHLDSIEAIIGAISTEAKNGDRVIVMSNGDFGGIHTRILESLRLRC